MRTAKKSNSRCSVTALPEFPDEGQPKQKPGSKDFSLIPRQPNGAFAKGYSPVDFGVLGLGGPRKGKQGGRAKILSLFDRIVGEAGHQHLLETELRAYIGEYGMLAFYQNYIFPLIPKEMVVKNLAGDSAPTAVNFNFIPRAQDVIEE